MKYKVEHQAEHSRFTAAGRNFTYGAMWYLKLLSLAGCWTFLALPPTLVVLLHNQELWGLYGLCPAVVFGIAGVCEAWHSHRKPEQAWRAAVKYAEEMETLDTLAES